jgi:hypothetical protein
MLIRSSLLEKVALRKALWAHRSHARSVRQAVPALYPGEAMA